MSKEEKTKIEEESKKNEKPLKEQESKKKKDSKKELNLPPIIDDDGINLVPVMTETEIVLEKTKTKVNVGVVVSIVIFLLITIAVVAFSTVSKLQLNEEKEKLFALEEEIKGQSTKILNNQEVLKRVYLYRDISSSQFPAREIFEYFTKIMNKQGTVVIKSFNFASGTLISFGGQADSLDTVSKLWYLLDKDPLIDSATMSDFNKSKDVVNFSFKVTLVEDAFEEEGENNIDN